MDSDLAFCLGQFIDDQVQLIDNRLEEIKKEEIVRRHEVEKEQAEFNRNKPIPKDKGSHDDEQALVDQFIRDLRDTYTNETTNKRTVLDDPSCIETLRAEVATKINACANYLNRLRNLAQPLPKTSNFVETCNTTIERFRQASEFENNFEALCTVLKECDSVNVLQNVQGWWKEKYGTAIIELNNRNRRINAAVTENNFAIIPQTSRVITNAQKLLSARIVTIVEPPKFEVIRKFVRRLLAVDEEKREKTNPEELIQQLINNDIEQVIDYAQSWLAKRDEVRNFIEVDPFQAKLDGVRAEYGRKCMAQEAKKLALAALLCRLAVGSTEGEQFDQQLKNTINKQKKSNTEGVPIISGEIRQPEAIEMPVKIQFEMGKNGLDPWLLNTDGIQERFGAALCRALNVPTKCIRIDGIDPEKGVVLLVVLPPYGKDVVESLNGTAPEAVARMKAVHQCFVDFNANVESITLGEFGLKVEDKLMDHRFNKVYGWSTSDSDPGDYWANSINQGGKPYFCPSGWRRFGIKVAADGQEFDARWSTWYAAYHGTRGENASKILTSGLKVSTQGCFYGDGVPRVYVSPSIEYCAHPRYAFPWKKTKKNGEVVWYQLVFQCRVNPEAVKMVGPETLLDDEYKQTVIVDPNFSNSELEWIIIGEDNEQFIKKDIICYGLMMRVSSVDPEALTPSAWWKQSHHADYKKKP